MLITISHEQKNYLALYAIMGYALLWIVSWFYLNICFVMNGVMKTLNYEYIIESFKLL